MDDDSRIAGAARQAVVGRWPVDGVWPAGDMGSDLGRLRASRIAVQGRPY
jgi:hypothetical protein